MFTMVIVTIVIVVVVAFIASVFLVLALALALALALVSVLARRGRRSVADRARSDGGGARERHRGLRERIAVEGSAGQADGRTRENRSHELRIRHRRGLGNPPVDVVAGRGGAGRGHREPGARQGAGPEGPDLEDPEPVRGPSERQHGVRKRRCRVDTVDTG